MSIYLYTASKQIRNLSYTVNPVSTTLVKAGQASQLKTFFKGKLVQTDVIAIQIAVWNSGTLSVKESDLLEPIIINIKNTPILDATIQKTTRSLTKVSLDETKANDGKVGVTWKILEPGDGLLIQLVYAGKFEENISVAGVVEGQHGITEERMTIIVPIEAETAKPVSQAKARWVWGISLMITSLITMFVMFFARWLAGIEGGLGKSDIAMLLIFSCLFLSGAWLYFLIPTLDSPFKF